MEPPPGTLPSSQPDRLVPGACRDEKLSYRESLSRYAELGRQRFDTDAFKEFRQRHLSRLDDVTWTYFGEPRAKEVIRAKVETLFPENEHEEFTELFWEQIQAWRRDESS